MKKIIIAENILNEVGGTGTLFRRGGINVFPSKTSEDILALHRSKKADLIITDIALPVMGGERLCSVIREDGALRGVSIILACDSAQASLPECRDAGANTIIIKPVDPVILFSKMSELIVVPQRKDMRVLLRVSVTGGQNDASFFATSENISISGMLLETNYRFKRDDHLLCSFFIGHSEVTVEGTVMRADRTSSGRTRYGIKFLNPPTKALIVIEQFVQRQRIEKNVPNGT
jgi:CheY-like chemotaxis protein